MQTTRIFTSRTIIKNIFSPKIANKNTATYYKKGVDFSYTNKNVLQMSTSIVFIRHRIFRVDNGLSLLRIVFMFVNLSNSNS